MKITTVRSFCDLCGEGGLTYRRSVLYRELFDCYGNKALGISINQRELDICYVCLEKMCHLEEEKLKNTYGHETKLIFSKNKGV